MIEWTHQAQATFDKAERQELYTQIQKQAAEDAFMVFLYYSPYRYATTDKVQGFQVYPTGNYHMEDVWLKPVAPAVTSTTETLAAWTV